MRVCYEKINIHLKAHLKHKLLPNWMIRNTDPYFTVQYKAKQYISNKLVRIRHVFITDDKKYLAPGTALLGKKAMKY
jgi:hypothetical protein